MSAEDDSEKSFDPTPQKLEKARRKGEVAKSLDVQVAAAYAGFCLCLAAVGGSVLLSTAARLRYPFEFTSEFSNQIFDGAFPAAVAGWGVEVASGLVPLFAVPAIFVLLSILLQRAFTFVPSKLQFKMSRINPLQNAKSKFGRSGLFEFAKSFIKLMFYSICLGLLLRARLDEMAQLIHSEPQALMMGIGALTLEFLLISVLITAAIATIDLLWQRQEHTRKNMMSRKELTDEAKDNEGDAQLKQKRRQRAQQIALTQMMQDVPSADVVIVNPTHYAVALKWSRQKQSAPVCVAKGVDEIAGKIRELAQENAVPIHSDPPCARLLFATVEIGNEIAPDHYLAVAAAIRFSEEMRRKTWK